jgi:hypothetical protein
MECFEARRGNGWLARSGLNCLDEHLFPDVGAGHSWIGVDNVFCRASQSLSATTCTRRVTLRRAFA